MGNWRAKFNQVVPQLKAIHLWKFDVENQAICPQQLRIGQRSFGRFIGDTLGPTRSEETAHRLTHGRVIIDQANSRRRWKTIDHWYNPARRKDIERLITAQLGLMLTRLSFQERIQAIDDWTKVQLQPYKRIVYSPFCLKERQTRTNW